MNAEAPLAVRSWPVGSRTCTLSVPRTKPDGVTQAIVVWTPDEPSRLSDAEWRQHRVGRHEALSAIAAELGISVAVLDL